MRLGVVGCGAVAEVCHLPAARQLSGSAVTALVDVDLERAKLLGRRFDVAYCTEKVSEISGKVDAVILAVPHHLHAQIAIELLGMHIPLLIEKPLARNVGEVEKIAAAAQSNGVLVQAGNMYRFCTGTHVVRQAIAEGWLGKLESFEIESGAVYDWPLVSGSLFNRTLGGGGVLLDAGSHLLDLLLLWLGDVLDVQYWDDCLGGLEADCLLKLALASSRQAVSGTVILSRVRNLSAIARIAGDRFTIEYELSTPDRVRIRPTASAAAAPSFALENGPVSGRLWREAWIPVYVEQLRAFVSSISAGTKSAVPVESILPSIALIDRCYRERQPIEWAWASTS